MKALTIPATRSGKSVNLTAIIATVCNSIGGKIAVSVANTGFYSDICSAKSKRVSNEARSLRAIFIPSSHVQEHASVNNDDCSKSIHGLLFPKEFLLKLFLVWRPGNDSPFSVYNRQTKRAMSQTISLGARTEAPLRINTSAILLSLSAAAAASTIIATAMGADVVASVSALLAFAGVYTHDRKGGAE